MPAAVPLEPERLLAGPSGGSAYQQQRAPLWWLLEREILRYLRIWRYSLVGPTLSTVLFVVVFGTVLAKRVDQVGAAPYGQYIVPGLLAQAVVNVGYFNGTTSLFEARRDRYLNDVLASPLRWWEINLALVVAAVVRGIICGGAVLAVAMPLTGLRVARPGYLFLALVALLVFAAQFGVIAGAIAKSFDHVYSIESLVLLPLGFLGGIFYPVSTLRAPWNQVSHANPFFWLVQAVREGFLGHSDVPGWVALVVVWGSAAALTGWSLFLFARRLQP